MDLLILSGHSSGLGLELLKLAQNQQIAVLGIARRQLANASAWTQECAIDLSQESPWEAHLDAALDRWPDRWSRIFLVNNAATIEPTARIAELVLEQLNPAYQLNVIAPLRLMSWVSRRFPQLPLRIANISSGAAQKPYQAWAVYCSSKAALRMLSQVLALEMQAQERDVRVLSYAPGVLNTPMQAGLRSMEPQNFPDSERFQTLYKTGQLVEPKASAQVLLDLLLSPDLAPFSDYRYGEGLES